MNDLKNKRLKDDIKNKLNEAEQQLVLEILLEIEKNGTINPEKAKQIGAKAFEGKKK